MNPPIQADELNNWSAFSGFKGIPEIILQKKKMPEIFAKNNEIRMPYFIITMQQK